jgi:hypothetical protein
VNISAVLLAVIAGLGASTLVHVQTTVSSHSNQTPVYIVNIVNRTARAVRYKHRSGGHKDQFSRGTRPFSAIAKI